MSDNFELTEEEKWILESVAEDALADEIQEPGKNGIRRVPRRFLFQTANR